MKKHLRPISVILACHVLSACQTLPLFNPVAEPERSAGETKPPSSLPRPKESNGQGFPPPPTTPPTTLPVIPPTNQPVVLPPPLIIPASVPQELTPLPLTPENIVSEPQTGQEAVKGEVLVLANSQPQLEKALRLSGGEILQARRQTGVVKLSLPARLNGETLTLTARKKSGNFTTPGTAYLKVGTFEPWGENHAQGPISAGTPGRELTDEKPMSAYGSGWPKAFYIRIENSGGHAWVGPITVNRRLE